VNVNVKILMLGMAATVLTGCSTANYQSSINHLQMKVGMLESQLEQKDEELADLRDEITLLTTEIRKKAQPERIVKPVEMDNAPVNKDGIIRVSVTTERVQAALKSAGFYTGPIDDKIGEKTKKAIADFQNANGLKADGIVGKQTWDKLSSYLE
jgi:murein L,D-transpeptidase YcbB/YkuD